MQLHLACVDGCLLMLDELQAGYEPRPNIGAVKVLVRRLADSGQAAFALMTEGFYQTSLTLQRDMLETGFLLELFLREPDSIGLWRSASNDVLKDKFSPWKVRCALQRDGADRGTIYQKYCELASHPTMTGSFLLVRDGAANAGPKLDVGQLGHCLAQLSRNVSYFTVTSCKLLEEDIPALKSDSEELLGYLRNWVRECLGLTLVTFDEPSLAEWARGLWPKHLGPVATPPDS
jgi:hypothetical protein